VRPGLVLSENHVGCPTAVSYMNPVHILHESLALSYMNPVYILHISYVNPVIILYESCKLSYTNPA
jgi:hypothetical protein